MPSQRRKPIFEIKKNPKHSNLSVRVVIECEAAGKRNLWSGRKPTPILGRHAHNPTTFFHAKTFFRDIKCHTVSVNRRANKRDSNGSSGGRFHPLPGRYKMPHTCLKADWFAFPVSGHSSLEMKASILLAPFHLCWK